MGRRSDLLGGEIPDGIPEDEVAELERQFREAGGKTGVGGYDRVLVEEAQRCAERAQAAHTSEENRAEAGAAGAAILCAAAACEARLSEYLAHYEFASGELPEDLEALRGSPGALQQWRDLLRHEAPDFDLGTSPEYLKLGCLFQLRDLVAHRNARLMELGTFPDRIEPCVRQRVIPVREAPNADWTSVVFVAEVALWAAQTAVDWILTADSVVPLLC